MPQNLGTPTSFFPSFVNSCIHSQFQQSNQPNTHTQHCGYIQVHSHQWLNLAPQSGLSKYQICTAPEPFDTLVTGQSIIKTDCNYWGFKLPFTTLQRIFYVIHCAEKDKCRDIGRICQSRQLAERTEHHLVKQAFDHIWYLGSFCSLHSFFYNFSARCPLAV